jgi:catechol 2,3-dioxygenase-like lactoylglutathione lyase family enzyme
MLHYSVVGTNDVVKSRQFYTSVLAILGLEPIYQAEQETVFAPVGAGLELAQFVVTRPFDGQAALAGNGTTIGFRAAGIAQVDAAHAAALAAGGMCVGAPGPRDYADNLYIAYFRDLDGNKIAVLHFSATQLPLPLPLPSSHSSIRH